MRSPIINVLPLLLVGASAVTAITCPPGFRVGTHPVYSVPWCEQCPEGTYRKGAITSETPTSCTYCAPGTFSSVRGVDKCCTCCQGSYQPAAGQTECLKCDAAAGGVFSVAGATSSSDCGSFVPGVTGNAGTCLMNGNQCPSTTQNVAAGSAVKRRRDLGCARGFKMCQRMSGLAEFDCVDVANDPESCGDCAAPFSDGKPTPGYTGQDCTAIPGVGVVNCRRGSCQIVTCRKGFVKSSDGKVCL